MFLVKFNTINKHTKFSNLFFVSNEDERTQEPNKLLFYKDKGEFQKHLWALKSKSS